MPPEPLLPENNDAWELWMAVHSQWRGAGMGVIGIDHHAVRAAAAELEIEMSPCMWGKINTLEQIGLKQLNNRPDK